MKNRIGLLVFALGMLCAAVWSPSAEATYPFCQTHCAAWSMPASANCTCYGTGPFYINSTCGQWQTGCELP
jgi:hypothetical protein